MDKNIVYILVVALCIAIGIIFVQGSHTQGPLNSPANILTPSPTPAINLLQQNQQGQNTQQSTQAQQTQPSPLTLNDIKAIATIKTAKGDIILQLDKKNAPLTVVNFINKARSGFYNGLLFHRVCPNDKDSSCSGPDFGLIQGGDPKGDGTGGGDEPVEFNNIPFKAGSLGQASRGDGKVQNDSQFFIVKQDSTWLNNKYTNYGSVIQGMDIVNKIQAGDKIISITIE